MKKWIAILIAAVLLLLPGCAQNQNPDGGDTVSQSYQQISQEEAKEMMAKDDGHIIVDVRRQDEYDAGHIPGAVLIPNESIGTEMPEELPDLEQIVLIYCRSGNRSKQAAQKLADMGYTNIYEFGGIIDWTGDVVTGEDATGEDATGEDAAGEDATGENATGEDAAKDQSDAELPTDADQPEELAEAVQPTPTLVIEANGQIFYAEPEDNSSAEAFIEKLSTGPLELDLHDYGSFEKVGPLPWELPTNDESITTEPGDVILYQGDQLTIYYDENTWDFTRLAKINEVTKEELLAAFGEGDVTVTMWVEWSE